MIVLDSVDVEMVLTVPGAPNEPVRRSRRKTAHLSGNSMCVSLSAVEGEDTKQAVLTELVRFIYRTAALASERVETPTAGGPLGGTARMLAECLEEFAMVAPESRDAWLRRQELRAPPNAEEWAFQVSAAAADMAHEDVSMFPYNSDDDDPKYQVTRRRKVTRTKDANDGFNPAAPENIIVQPGLAPELGDYRLSDNPTVLLNEPVVPDTPAPRGLPAAAGEEPWTSENDGSTPVRTPSGRSMVDEDSTTSAPISSGDANGASNLVSTHDSGEDSELWPTPSSLRTSRRREVGMPSIGVGVGHGPDGVDGGWSAGMSPEFDSPLTIDIESIRESSLPPLEPAAMSSIVGAAGATAVGRAGEACVFQHLSRLGEDRSLASELLADDGKDEMHGGAWTVEWLNADSESGRPYDIVCRLHGADGCLMYEIFVEVKSTSGVDKTRFEISAQEIEFMQRNPHRCVIARVYDVVSPYDRIRLRLVQRPWEMTRRKAVRLEMII